MKTSSLHSQTDTPLPLLDIEIDERMGSVRVRDARLFQAKRRAFCRRLLEIASGRPGLRKAEIDLNSSTFRLEFALGTNSAQSMAGTVVSALQEAATSAASTRATSWWRRLTGKWSTLTAFRLPEGTSYWESFEERPGRMRLRHKGDPVKSFPLLADWMAELDGIESCRVSSRSDQLTIDFRQDRLVPDRLVNRVEQALEALISPERRENRILPQSRAGFSTGMKRLKNLALAGGSFALTIVAIVIPGLPTVPFLLATSYYLARSSPRLDARLRRTALFGPILQEWEEYGAVSRSSKWKLIGFSLSIVTITVILTPFAPVMLLVIVVMSTASLTGIALMPTLPEPARPRLSLNGPTQLMLPAP